MFHVEHIHVEKLCDFPIILRVQNSTFAADEASRKMFLELGFNTAFICLGMALDKFMFCISLFQVYVP